MTAPLKSKEELAAEFAMEWLEKNKPVVVYDMAKALYLAGFDAGFQRAVEMLRNKRAFNLLKFKGEHRLANEQLADWLENQSPKMNVPEESKKDNLKQEALA